MPVVPHPNCFFVASILLFSSSSLKGGGYVSFEKSSASLFILFVKSFTIFLVSSSIYFSSVNSGIVFLVLLSKFINFSLS